MLVRGFSRGVRMSVICSSMTLRVSCMTELCCDARWAGRELEDCEEAVEAAVVGLVGWDASLRRAGGCWVDRRVPLGAGVV